MSSRLELYHVLYCNNLHIMCVMNSLALTHYVTAGIDCMEGTCFVCSWSGVYNIIGSGECVSDVLLYTYLAKARTCLAFSYHCSCVGSKQAQCLQRLSSGFRSPPVWRHGRHLSTNVRNSICISAISINSGVSASLWQKSNIAFAVWWQNVLSYLEVTCHHPAVLGIQSHFCCRR